MGWGGHAATHAADVLQSVHYMLKTAGASQFLSDIQVPHPSTPTPFPSLSLLHDGLDARPAMGETEQPVAHVLGPDPPCMRGPHSASRHTQARGGPMRGRVD